MKLDRLLALIRLANNNPNEHEANLAARKACKVLASSEFEVVEKARYYTAQGSIREGQKSTVTWNDVKRSTKAAWSSTPHDPQSSRYDPFTDLFNSVFGSRFRGGQRANKQYGQKVSEEEWARWNNVGKKAAPTPEEEARYKEKYEKHASNYGSKKPFDPSDTETWVGREYKVHIDPDKMPKYDKDGKKVKPPETVRKCTKCQLEVKTRRKDEPFICTICLWQIEELKKKGAY